MNPVRINGVQLNDECIRYIQLWQEEENAGLVDDLDLITNVAYHLSNASVSLDDKERLSLVAQLLELRQYLSTFRCIKNRGGVEI